MAKNVLKDMWAIAAEAFGNPPSGAETRQILGEWGAAVKETLQHPFSHLEDDGTGNQVRVSDAPQWKTMLGIAKASILHPTSTTQLDGEGNVLWREKNGVRTYTAPKQ